MAGQYAYSVFPVGMLETNCYMIRNTQSGETILIDPGDDGEKLSEACRASGGRVCAILLTHGHHDHIQGIPALKEAFPDLLIYAGEKEEAMLENASLNVGMGFAPMTLKADVTVRDGESLEIAGLNFRVLETPGHTAGSVCYYLETEGMLFAGDTLFAGSYGRTDLPTGSEADIRKSIRRLADSLPEETRVYPGHGGFTSIGREKAVNPLL